MRTMLGVRIRQDLEGWELSVQGRSNYTFSQEWSECYLSLRTSVFYGPDVKMLIVWGWSHEFTFPAAAVNDSYNF